MKKSDVSNKVIKNYFFPYHIDCQLYRQVRLKINFEKTQNFCSNPQVIVVLSHLPRAGSMHDAVEATT